MRKLLILGVLILLSAGSALAQETPKAELFGGYEYLHLNPLGRSCHGGGGSLAYNLNNWIGAVGDFGVFKETGSGSGLHDVNYLFGPRVSYRGDGSFTPFAQVLFGGQHEAWAGRSTGTLTLHPLS